MNTPPFTVCIAAAGSGSRMQRDIPKQYISIAGKPVLAHTLEVFACMASCRQIVIATDDRQKLDSLLSDFPMKKQIVIVEGGAVRQLSVMNMLQMCKDDEEIILIHDAARPCVSNMQISAVVQAIEEHGAALLALPARDTVKVGDGRFVRHTLDRSSIWLAQTPQGARAGALRHAFADAERAGFTGTDDASLLERCGIPVRLVEGSPSNLKITTPSDVFFAEQTLLNNGNKH
jgi:2-C-methyl-D-erythritol 4-phosphate cytidylyltransferase